MFAQLTNSENNELYVRMARAGGRYYRITGLLTATVHFDRYMDAWREIIQLQQDLNDSYNPGAEPAPEPAKPAGRTDQRCTTCHRSAHSPGMGGYHGHPEPVRP